MKSRQIGEGERVGFKSFDIWRWLLESFLDSSIKSFDNWLRIICFSLADAPAEEIFIAPRESMIDGW